MASSKEALDRFRMWKKSNTVLKVTVLTKGEKPETLTGTVSAIDEELLLIGFAVPRIKWFRNVCLDGASFTIGKRSLLAEISAEEVLTCEEL